MHHLVVIDCAVAKTVPSRCNSDPKCAHAWTYVPGYRSAAVLRLRTALMRFSDLRFNLAGASSRSRMGRIAGGLRAIEFQGLAQALRISE